MKTETVEIYTYSELSEEAQERARQWWIELEYTDPTWQYEHCDTLDQTLAFAREILTGYETGTTEPLSGVRLWKYVQNSNGAEAKAILDGSSSLTCYYAGEIALGPVLAFLNRPSACDTAESLLAEIRSAMDQHWEEELDYRCSAEQVSETITANSYEFNVKGSRS